MIGRAATLVFLGGLAAMPAGAQKPVPNKCAMMFEDLAPGPRPSKLERATFEEIPRSIYDQLPSIQAHKGTQLVYQLPTTLAEYQKVYGPTAQVSKAVEDEIARARNALPSAQLAGGRNVSATTFRQAIGQSESDVVVVIGHNHRGKFGFVDGTTRDLIDLAEDCGIAKKLCVFLSCHAAQVVSSAGALAVSRAIDFDTAISIAKSLQRALEERKAATFTYAEIEALLRKLDLQAARLGMSVVAVKCTGGVATGVGLAVVVDRLESRER